MINSYFVNDLESKLYRLSIKNNFSNIVFVCIGSNKIVGDSIGPIVGNKLLEKNKLKNINVIGTTTEPVNYQNIDKFSQYIQESSKDSCVISIDSAMGKTKQIGQIYVNWGNLEIGKAIRKKGICRSHINIKVVVARNKNNILDNLYELSKVKTEYIAELTEDISACILNVVNLIV